MTQATSLTPSTSVDEVPATSQHVRARQGWVTEQGACGCQSEQTQQLNADDLREAAIEAAGKAVIEHMTEWRRSGCFSARGAADAASQRQRELILGRSPAAVAKMEALIQHRILFSAGAERT